MSDTEVEPDWLGAPKPNIQEKVQEKAKDPEVAEESIEVESDRFTPDTILEEEDLPLSREDDDLPTTPPTNKTLTNLGQRRHSRDKIVPIHRQTRSLDETSVSSAAKDARNGRRGSTCQAIHKIPTIVQTFTSSSEERQYIKKENLTEEEKKENDEIFQEAMRAEFPDEEMIDPSFRDKDKDYVMKTWILEVLGELDENPKARNKKLQETGEYEFYLQSGVALCALANKVVPGSTIDTDKLKSGNLLSRRQNISLFLKAAEQYGVPKEYLFQPDDLATCKHVHRVTRTLFALGELTKQDANFSGAPFTPDTILRDLITQGIRRKSSCRDMEQVNTSIHSIFENLMQDVQRRNSLSPRGPPKNIYKNY